MSDKGKKTLDPSPGDVCVFDWENDKFEDHIGIFIKWDEPHKWAICIEGNTSPDEKGSQSNGGRVCRKRRHVSTIEGFYNLIDL